MDNPTRDSWVSNKEADTYISVKSSSPKWHEFVEGTTLHGIRHVFGSNKLWAKTLWLIFLLTSAVFFFYQAYINIAKYYKFPMTTEIRNFNLKTMPFPAVSVCPSNILQKSKIYALDSDSVFINQGLNISACDVTAAVRKGRPCGHALLCCCVSIGGGFLGSDFVSNCTQEYRDELRNAIDHNKESFDTAKFYSVYSQDITEMLTPFSTFGPLFHRINKSDFSETITEFGKCYTFNSGKPGYPMKTIQVSGPSLGLNLMLDLNVDDYAVAMWTEGVRVVIHNQGEFFDLWNGVLVSPGTLASLMVSQTKYINLPAPYETNCKSQTLELYTTYSEDGCMDECYSLAVQDECGCRMPSFPVYKDLRVCYLSDDDCIGNSSDKIDNARRICECSTSCENVEFFTEQSTASFPDLTTRKLFEREGYSFDYVKKNLVSLQIGYKSLSYDRYQQQPSYEMGTLLSQIGGNMGMFLGCSLLTLCEFLGFFASFFFRMKLTGNRNEPPNG